MKKFFTLLTFMAVFHFSLMSQTALDFTFTDTNGNTHQMQDALDQGYIILMDFFFVDCPPCQESAPELKAIVEDYTDQGKNMIMWSLSDRDDDAYIETFKTQFGLTNAAGGTDGGGDDVINLYAGQFNFFGFPTVSVICPNGSISWDIWPYSAGAPEWRNAIDACGVTDADPYQPLTPSSAQDIATVDEVQLSISPNPFAGEGFLDLLLSESSDVQVEVLTIDGQLLTRWFDGQLPAGEHRLPVSGQFDYSGTMLVKVTTEMGVLVRKVINKG
jgi:thiol-disulfide isomerase/thioredoxin